MLKSINTKSTTNKYSHSTSFYSDLVGKFKNNYVNNKKILLHYDTNTGLTLFMWEKVLNIFNKNPFVQANKYLFHHTGIFEFVFLKYSFKFNHFVF